MLTRRRVLTGFAATAGATTPLLAACGASTEQAATASLTPSKLVIWGATNDGGHSEGDGATPFRREFGEKHRGVTVEALRIVAGGTTGFASPEEKFLSAVAGGEPPDLYSTGRAGTMSGWALDGEVRRAPLWKGFGTGGRRPLRTAASHVAATAQPCRVETVSGARDVGLLPGTPRGRALRRAGPGSPRPGRTPRSAPQPARAIWS